MGIIPTLATERLVLRPFRLGDAPDVARLAGDRSIADTTTNIPHPYEEGMAADWISQHQAVCERHEGVAFAITLRSDGTLVGAISLMGMKQGHHAELGYWIGKPSWGLGSCTEASREVLRYAFENLGLVRVHASHFARNPASGRVIRKIGMHSEGCRRHHVRKSGQVEDLKIYGIHVDEWRAMRDEARCTSGAHDG